jgi:hypothetical protein
MVQLNPSPTALMAAKRPKSILSSLKNMLQREEEKPSAPAPKPSAPARRKSAAPAAEKRAPVPPPAETPAAQEAAPEAKSEKKKTQNQPWYRHRQRW